MSQFARWENAPHRAAFVTSRSRWYIRRLLGNSPPFHPCLSAERRPRIVPYGTSSPYGLLPRNQGTASPFCLPLCIPERGRARGGQQCRITGKFSYVAMVPRRAHTMELWNMKTYLCFMKKGHLSLYSFLLTKRSIF